MCTFNEGHQTGLVSGKLSARIWGSKEKEQMDGILQEGAFE